jgi:molybdopterin-guanine dinucleotide biosynthesis protein A
VTAYEPTSAQGAADTGNDVVYDAVVLAGGGARRLGGVDKPGVRVGGRALLDRVLAACADARTTVVVADPRPTARPVIWAREDPPGGGPVAALDAGLRHTAAEQVVVLSADLPFLEEGTVRRLLAALRTSGADGALLTDATDRDQPLVAAYRASVLRRELAALAEARAGGGAGRAEVAGTEAAGAGVGGTDAAGAGVGGTEAAGAGVGRTGAAEAGAGRTEAAGAEAAGAAEAAPGEAAEAARAHAAGGHGTGDTGSAATDAGRPATSEFDPATPTRTPDAAPAGTAESAPTGAADTAPTRAPESAPAGAADTAPTRAPESAPTGVADTTPGEAAEGRGVVGSGGSAIGGTGRSAPADRLTGGSTPAGRLTGLPLRRLIGALDLTRVPDPVASFDCDTWDDIATARARIREHGHVLDEWITAVKDELGIDLDVDIKVLLDLARDAAHGVARPAAPLTTFLVGYAAARAQGGEGGPEAVAEASRKAAALALRWAQEAADAKADAAPDATPDTRPDAG